MLVVVVVVFGFEEWGSEGVNHVGNHVGNEMMGGGRDWWAPWCCCFRTTLF